MRYLRKLCAVAVFTVLFAFTAFAGETPYPGIASPLPQPSAVNPVMEVAMNLLQSVLALF